MSSGPQGQALAHAMYSWVGTVYALELESSQLTPLPGDVTPRTDLLCKFQV